MAANNGEIELVAEVALVPKQKRALAALLHQCFPDYPGNQLFYPQPPHFRLLCWEGDQLIGHLATVIRSILVGGKTFTIFGLADICTDPKWKGQRVAGRLLQKIETIARIQNVPFLMIMTAEQPFFQQFDFKMIDVRCTWLAFMQGKSLGLFQRTPPSGLMVKSVGSIPWPDGDVDLLGPLF